MSDASPASLNPVAPPILRFGALVAILQSVVAFLVGFWLIWRDIQTAGADSPNLESTAPAAEWIGMGTALLIFVIFGATGAGAVNLFRGGRWGRGPIVLLEVLLAFVAFYMFSGGAVMAGAATALSLVLVLIGMLHPQSAAWFERNYGG